jgi:hypothetical protein
MQQTVPEIASVENQINLFFHNHSLGKLLRQCNIKKEKGIPLESLVQFLLALHSMEFSRTPYIVFKIPPEPTGADSCCF